MDYKNISGTEKISSIMIKIIKERVNYSTLYLPLISYKGLQDKLIITERPKELLLSRLNNKYKIYVEMLKTKDNINNLGLNILNESENSLIRNKYLNILKNSDKITKLFNKKINILDSYYLGKKYAKINIIEENNNN